jgi:hypothetical protein
MSNTVHTERMPMTCVTCGKVHSPDCARCALRAVGYAECPWITVTPAHKRCAGAGCRRRGGLIYRPLSASNVSKGHYCDIHIPVDDAMESDRIFRWIARRVDKDVNSQG